MSLSVITIKIPFLSSLLISLCRKSINGGSCTRTNISVYRDCLTDIPVGLADIPIELANMPVELAGMPVELINMPIEVIWFSIIGFLFAGYFQGHPQLHFIAGLAGSVGF